MRLLFAGTAAIALSCLEMLAKNFDLVGVLTAVDKTVGRHRSLQPTAAKKQAQHLQIPVFQPQRLDSDFEMQIKKLQADLLVVFAYGKIFKTSFLELFSQGGINVHPSLLPKHRGASPLVASILAGDKEYGISVQRLAKKMDSGNILMQKSYPLYERATTAQLNEEVAQTAPELLRETLVNWSSLSEWQQDESRASYCSLLKKEDALIDWSQSAQLLARQVRAYNPWPRSYTFLSKNASKDQERCFIHQAVALNEEDPHLAEHLPKSRKTGSVLGFHKECGLLCQCGSGILAVQKLQRQQRRILSAADFLHGLPSLIGSCFSSEGRDLVP